MTDEEKLEGLVGRTIVWADLDDGMIHLETQDGLMFHIPYDTDYALEINGDLPN